MLFRNSNAVLGCVIYPKGLLKLTEGRNAKRRKTRTKTTRRRADKNDDLNELFRIFIDIKEAEGRSKPTLDQHRNGFESFLRFLEVRGITPKASNISKEVIRDFIRYLSNEAVRFDGHKYKSEGEKTVGFKTKTINHRLKTLKTFYKTLCDEEYLRDNPTTTIKTLRNVEEEIDILTVDELRQLFNTPDQRAFAEFRDYVLMNFLLDAMCRISEALSVTEDNFDFSGNAVTFYAQDTKAKKARTVPIEARTCKLIKELIEENREDFDSPYVFLTNYGEQMERNHFRKRLYMYANRAGISKQVHPHLFRHTSATMFLEAGGDLRHLQILLGHSDLRMVVRYTHLSERSLTKQHQKHSAINSVIGKLNKSRKIKR